MSRTQVKPAMARQEANCHGRRRKASKLLREGLREDRTHKLVVGDRRQVGFPGQTGQEQEGSEPGRQAGKNALERLAYRREQSGAGQVYV